MNNIKFFIRKVLQKVNINISFYVFLILVIFFQIYELFFYCFIFVLLHELSHIFVARYFGIKLKKIIITPIGQIACLDNIDGLVIYKRLLIISAGVIFNLVMVLFFSIFTNEKMQLIKNVNLSIAFFNMLPIFPLDGGRFFSYCLGYKIGSLKASRIIKRVSIFLSFFIGVIGFIQIVLIPYHISLLCLSVYFIKINRENYVFEFYRNILNKYGKKSNFIFKLKEIVVDENCLNKDILLILSIDYYTVINVSVDGCIRYSIDEKIFLEYILKYGILGKISDVLESQL